MIVRKLRQRRELRRHTLKNTEFRIKRLGLWFFHTRGANFGHPRYIVARVSEGGDILKRLTLDKHMNGWQLSYTSVNRTKRKDRT